MFDNYTIIVDKGVCNEKYIYHIFIFVLSVPNYISNHFIEQSQYEWDKGTEVETGEMIQKGNQKMKYHGWSYITDKKEPNGAKIIALTTCIFKLKKVRNIL